MFLIDKVCLCSLNRPEIRVHVTSCKGAILQFPGDTGPLRNNRPGRQITGEKTVIVGKQTQVEHLSYQTCFPEGGRI
jgi:hypothetical protein